MLATRQLLVLYIISNLCSCQHAGADGADLVQIRLQHDRGTNPTKCDGVTIAPCTQTDGKWFMPLNMAGQGRTVASPAGCQKRCEDTTGCKAFNNFPNGGCHMSTAAAGTKSGGGNPTKKSGLVTPKVMVKKKAVLIPGTFSAISSTSSRGDEAHAIDGDLTTYSWMTKYGTTATPQTITASMHNSCAKLGGVSWSTGPITKRGTATDDLSVRFQMVGKPVSAVVDESNPKVVGTFTSSPKSSGWHLTAVAVEGKSYSFAWPLKKTTELKLVFKVSGYVHWPIYEISPRCSATALAKKKPKTPTLTWYTKPGDTSTYKSDASFCANKGGRLATYAEYCPGGEGADPYDGTKDGDQWAAYSGAGPNMWVEVGTRGGNSLCKKHTVVVSYKPSWGTNTDKRSYETYTLCALPGLE